MGGWCVGCCSAAVAVDAHNDAPTRLIHKFEKVVCRMVRSRYIGLVENFVRTTRSLREHIDAGGFGNRNRVASRLQKPGLTVNAKDGHIVSRHIGT